MSRSHDILDRGIRIPLDKLPSHFLQDIPDRGDSSIDPTSKDSLNEAVKYLTAEEFNLLVRRFFIGESLKTIRRFHRPVPGTGSTRTIILRVKRLKKVLGNYKLYFDCNDHDRNLDLIESELGNGAVGIVEDLFKGIPRSRIYREHRGVLTRRKIAKVIEWLAQSQDSGIKSLHRVITENQRR